MKIVPDCPCGVVLPNKEVTQFLSSLDHERVFWQSGHSPMDWNPTKIIPGYEYYRISFSTQPFEPDIVRMTVVGYTKEPVPYETDVFPEDLGFKSEVRLPLNLSLIFS